MDANETIAGEIIGIRDLGCGYIMFLDSGDGRVLPITLDRRAVWELRSGGQVEWTDLIGQHVRIESGKATLTFKASNRNSR